MDMLIEILINGGPMGLFAGYLIWQTKEQQKRMDSWVQQIAETERKANVREGELRDRYDQVISKLEAEKLDIFKRLSTATDNLMVKMNELSSDVKVLAEKVSTIEQNIARIEQDIDVIQKSR